MITTNTYYKNSNTGELIIKQEFTETNIKLLTYIFYYDKYRKSIDTQNLIGFVPISEKKFNKESKK